MARTGKKIPAEPYYQPSVNIKLIFSKENNRGFSPVSWEEIEKDQYNSLLWLEINPIKEELVRALILKKTTYKSNFIKGALVKQGIPFENIKNI